MTTHLLLLVTLTWLRIIDNSLWKTFDNLDLTLVTSRRDHLWKILTIWLAICAWYLHENNITLKYLNTFVTVTSDRKEGKSGLLVTNITVCIFIPAGNVKILFSGNVIQSIASTGTGSSLKCIDGVLNYWYIYMYLSFIYSPWSVEKQRLQPFPWHVVSRCHHLCQVCWSNYFKKRHGH